MAPPPVRQLARAVIISCYLNGIGEAMDEMTTQHQLIEAQPEEVRVGYYCCLLLDLPIDESGGYASEFVARCEKDIGAVHDRLLALAASPSAKKLRRDQRERLAVWSCLTPGYLKEMAKNTRGGNPTVDLRNGSDLGSSCSQVSGRSAR